MQTFDADVCTGVYSFLHILTQLSDHFSLSPRKLNAHLHIHLTYDDLCYFCKITLSNDEKLDLSESFVRDQRLWIHSTIYNSMHSFAPYFPKWDCILFLFFIFTSNLNDQSLIHPIGTEIFFFSPAKRVFKPLKIEKSGNISYGWLYILVFE